jgi:hypothetical protein
MYSAAGEAVGRIVNSTRVEFPDQDFDIENTELRLGARRSSHEV